MSIQGPRLLGDSDRSQKLNLALVGIVLLKFIDRSQHKCLVRRFSRIRTTFLVGSNSFEGFFQNLVVIDEE